MVGVHEYTLYCMYLGELMILSRWGGEGMRTSSNPKTAGLKI